ncbi:hypothetical protein PFMALIP_02055 [Plasmodium falciparum MaliPS096_E11]|uniref:Uncharacterized protein n=1 Tax=Plasmodium falciparum MaliPS096_E11 TaxID=1036727 RepID=A0A024WT42_PLAFA|nr:hypothetical protein PFMALIP_02055 [Plasmodium falciparum MaliPS096_E11]
MSRKTISKLIHLYLMSSNERGVSNKIDQILISSLNFLQQKEKKK